MYVETHMERESWQKHKMLPLALHAHKLKLDESAENSQRASGAARMARNVINDHCEFEIGLKRTDWTNGKAFFIKRSHHHRHAPHTTSARKSSADRPPNAVEFL
jgi:hypothetical protein